MKAIVLGVSLLLSVACASPSATGKGASATEKGASGGDVTTTQALANADSDNTYICEKVKPTGSNIPEEVCKTVRQRRQEREDAQRLMLRPRTEANKQQ